MNQDVLNKWVTALRSGEYPQSQGRLKTMDGFCCLGVLCDLYTKETGQGSWDHAGVFKTETAENITYPPQEVYMWLGHTFDRDIEIERIKFDEGLFLGSLVSMNDYGLSFNEIADEIENNYKVQGGE